MPISTEGALILVAARILSCALNPHQVLHGQQAVPTGAHADGELSKEDWLAVLRHDPDLLLGAFNVALGRRYGGLFAMERANPDEWINGQPTLALRLVLANPNQLQLGEGAETLMLGLMADGTVATRCEPNSKDRTFIRPPSAKGATTR